MFSKLKKVLRKLTNPRLHKTDIDASFERYGEQNASFPMISENLTKESTIFSFGIGENISFELDVVKRIGCTVHAFDPTPRSIEWIKTQQLPSLMKVHQYGIGGADENVTFFPPEREDFVSYSIKPGQKSNSDKAITSQVLRLGTIVKKLKTKTPDVVRMNIEGFEFPALEDFVRNGPWPKQLFVEFHHGFYGIDKQATQEMVSLMRSAGYRIYYISGSGRGYGFVYLPDLETGRP